MNKKMIRTSGEDYLEAILIRIKIDGACRVTDIAKQMGFSKASTSVALKKLEDEGYVARDDWKIILTTTGKEIAERIYERHKFFKAWFQEMGVSEERAEKDACLIEHVLSEETYEKIKEHVLQN